MENNITDTFKKTYEEYSDSIFRFSLTRVSDREQALDITQETFLRLWKTMSEKKPIKNSQAFLFTIAKHLIIDWYRKKKSISLDQMIENENIPFDVPDESSFKVIELGIEGKNLLSKINDLPPIYRDSIYLRLVEDLPPKEISEILNVSVNVISVRINRGLEELKKITGYENEKNN